MENLLQDLRWGCRALRYSPGRLVLAVLALAIGVGVNIAVFAVVHGVLLAPLPYTDPDRLVSVTIVRPGDDTSLGVRSSELDAWRDALDSVTRLAAYAVTDATLVTGNESRAVRAAIVSEDFFETLQPTALRGRAFEQGRSDSTAVLNPRLERELVGPTDSLLGGPITVGDRTYTVVGFLPRSGAYPTETIDVWIPAGPSLAASHVGARRYHLVGRLHTGTKPMQVQALARRYLDSTHPEHSIPATETTVLVERIEDRLLEPVRPALVGSVAAAVLVLAVACANASFLLVARAIGRWREIAIRSALGAKRSRLIWGFLAEGLVIALLATVAGTALAALTLRAVHLVGVDLPRLDSVGLGPPIILACAGLALVVAIGASVVSGLYALRIHPEQVLRQSCRFDVSTPRLANGLVVAQIAIAVVLVIAAGLLSRTLAKLLDVDIGLESTGVVATRLMLTQAGGRLDAADRAPLVFELLEQVRALPGVSAAGMSSNMPPGTFAAEVEFTIISEDREEAHLFSLAAVTPGLIEALGIGTPRGRAFQERDMVTETPVVVVSESAASALFLDSDPLRQALPAALPFASDQRARVLGIVRDVKYGGLDVSEGGTIYLPWTDLPFGNMYLVVRSSLGVAIASDIRRVVHDLAPGHALSEILSIEDLIVQSAAGQRIRALVATAFAGLAVVLTLLGLLGTVARRVVERRHELAVRAALGATPSRLGRFAVRQGMAAVAAGLAIGMTAAYLVAQGIAGALYGITPWDPATFIGAGTAILLACLLAVWVPARRAMRVAPGELLRN